MVSIKILLGSVLLISSTLNSIAQNKIEVDVCIYGGTSAGVMAAYTAKKLGKKVILIEPGNSLGGLSSGGLGFTDIGNKYAISGLALDFYRRIGAHYGKFEQWIFEPHVAEDLFRQYISRAGADVLYGQRLLSVQKQGKRLKQIILENASAPDANTGHTVSAKVFIDCTYEGDLMAQAGVAFIVGRESNDQYNETYNGFQLRDKHQFADSIDPYKTKGDPGSGLLWGISDATPDSAGTGDKKVQAYNFRICLSKNPENSIAITRPDGYDSTKYELLLRVLEKEPNRPFNLVMKPDIMPNQKTDINNNGPFSTDMIGMNYDFPAADYATRRRIQKEHELYTRGLLYFIGHDPRVPKHLASEMLKYGYPKDEYADNGHWSPQMYVREARRMIGSYVMTQANCEGREVVQDGVGMAAYTMDSHNCQRIVVTKNGMRMVKNEGDVQIGGFPPYPISYRSIVPKQSECENLLVPVCLSATHIAYGSIRMEPVFMVMGQSAATAAVLAIDQKTAVQKINVRKLQSMLHSNPLADGSRADIFVDNEQSADIKLMGGWELNRDPKNNYAASSFRINGSEGGNASVKFTPTIPVSGRYKVYSYTPKLIKPSTSLSANVYDGRKLSSVAIDMRSFKVEGQTSGEWVELGEYIFEKGRTGFIEITNKTANGTVVADAVLLVPSK
ncbi:MAG: FAD-dependent oxidoreductase [Chitinophagaceae bacterium]|nr:MAG: FAD-dependent oxidoreductase [Chitinophagaceae bacterium]